MLSGRIKEPVRSSEMENVQGFPGVERYSCVERYPGVPQFSNERRARDDRRFWNDQRFWDEVFLLMVQQGASPAAARMDADKALRYRKEARRERIERERERIEKENERISNSVREELEKSEKSAEAVP